MRSIPEKDCKELYPISNFSFHGISQDNQDDLRSWYTKNCIDCSVQKEKLKNIDSCMNF